MFFLINFLVKEMELEHIEEKGDKPEEVEEMRSQLGEKKEELQLLKEKEDNKLTELFAIEKTVFPELFLLHPELNFFSLKELGGLEKRRSLSDYEDRSYIAGGRLEKERLNSTLTKNSDIQSIKQNTKAKL